MGTVDVVISNPPYTRATGRGRSGASGAFPFIADKVEREKLRVRLSQLRRRAMEHLTGGRRGGYGQAGEALLFLAMGFALAADDGIVAMVLPSALLTGASWEPARRALSSMYQLLYIVTSADLEKGTAFSDGSSLDEILLVARKRRPQMEDIAYFVELAQKPASVEAAVSIARSIAGAAASLASTNPLRLAEIGEMGTVQKVRVRELSARAWSWGPFANLGGVLLDVLDMVESGSLPGGVRIPVSRLGDIASSIGIDRRQFRSLFRESVDGLPAFLGGGEENRSGMLVEPNARITPLGSDGARVYSRFSSRLLVPDRIRWNTVHATAVLSSEPVLSNMFYSVRLKGGGIEEEKALAVWLNSVWGVITMYGYSSFTEGMWAQLKLYHWRRMPVLDVLSLGREKVERLARIFDRYSSRSLSRLPEQFLDKERRLELDASILTALDQNLSLGEALDKVRIVYELLLERLCLKAGCHH